jgi:uncharacterized membrane protein
MPRLSIFEAYGFAWKTVKENWATLVPVVAALSLIVVIIGEFITRAQPAVDPSAFDPTMMVNFAAGSLLNMVVSVVITALVIKVALKYVDGENPKEFGALFSGITPEMLLKLILASILYTLVVVIGFILLIIPGIYLMLRYSQVQYVIIDRDAGVLEAFAESARLTKGVKFAIAGLFLMAIPVLIAGALVLLVGLLVAVPVVYVAIAHAYRQLTRTVDEVVGGVVAPAESAA